MTKPLDNLPAAPVKGRIRPALARAVTLIVEGGCTYAEAAKTVGMQEESLSRAMRKPHVRALREAVKRAWLDNQTGKAWLTVAQLASGAASEDVRLKAAKLFLEAAGELDQERDGSTAPRSLVQILINHAAGGETGESASHPGVIQINHTPSRSGGEYEVLEA